METFVCILLYFLIRLSIEAFKTIINDNIQYYSIHNQLIRNAIKTSERQLSIIYSQNMIPNQCASLNSLQLMKNSIKIQLIFANLLITKEYLISHKNTRYLIQFNNDVKDYFCRKLNSTELYNSYADYKLCEELALYRTLFLPRYVSNSEIILTHVLYGINYLDYSSIIYYYDICHTLTNLITNTF